MKRLVLLVSLALLTVVGTTATTQAYYLDTPHNESNGIYCSTCHYSPAYGLPDPAGDNARVNKVCLQCHGETLTPVTFRNKLYDFSAFRGPVKKLHASSTTSTDFGTWSTKCTQCHDVHFQGQLDWTDSSLFLATGTITSDNLPYDKNDGTYGSTTVAIGTPVANPVGSGWDNTSKWTSKGDNVTASSATDGTRGLIFVPNRNTPAETFEIISATPTSVKVKGKMTTALGGNGYGVIYGQSLKSYVLPNGGSKVSDLRAVKFFRPEVIAGTFGGYVDESATATPQGLCQVCHSNAAMVWLKNGTVKTHHAGEKCGTCHNGPGGFKPGKNHNLFIVNPATNGCNACHANKVANPDSAHTGGCIVCHKTSMPEISNPEISLVNMTSEATGTVLQTLLGKGFTGGTTATGRLKDSTVKDIYTTGFAMDCGSCHVTKPAAVGAGTHGAGHTAASFAWGTANCSDCHSGADIVVNVHSNSCILCHVNADGTGGRKIGDIANGVDGHANLENSASTCIDCHNDNTPGTIHHNLATTADNCVTLCHNTGHVGDHTGKVATDTCVPCHDAVVGGTGGAPVDGSVIANKKHDKCVSCHNLNGTMKSVAEVGNSRVTAMPTIGGACSACHTTYTFTSHTAHSHALTVTSLPLCGSCHTVTNTIVDTHLNNCALCHNTTTGARIGSAVNSPTGGSCTACHLNYFTNHTHNHTFGPTTACTTCHGNNVVGSNAKNATSDAFATTGEVHGTLGCGTCHAVGTTGARIGSGSALLKAEVIECISCHIDTWTLTHTGATGLVHTGGRVGVTAGCDSCHHTAVTAGSDARDALATPFIGTGEVHDGPDCATCHTGANTGALRSSGFTHANTTVAGTVGGTVTNTCVSCHTAADWATAHASATVSHNVTATASSLCSTTCHISTSMIAVIHNNNCADCHNPATGARVDGSGAGTHLGTNNLGSALVNGGAGGSCVECHAAHFAGHTHAHLFTVTAACAGCHGNPTSSGAGREAINPPYILAGQVHDNIGLTRCDACHDLTTDGHTIGLAAGKLNTAQCSDCHGTVWQTIHAAATVSHNASVIGVDAACNGCHATAAVVGSLGRKLGTTSPYMAATGDIHFTNGCATCHSGDGTVRSSGLTKADRVGTGGTCTYCHANTSTWTSIHTGLGKGVSHVGRAEGLAACTTCHDATAGGAAGLMPVDVTSGTKVHDACITCHTAAGGVKAGNTTYGALPIAKGTCGTCHGAGYFNSHVHHNGANNQVVYDSLIDRSQGVNLAANACAECHNDKTGNNTSFNTWEGIRFEHDINDGTKDLTGGCNTCHDYATVGERSGTAGTPLLATVQTVVATNATAKCTTCHTPKLQPAASSVHGGHAAADFTGHSDCITCHVIPGTGVVEGIHHNTCTLCHSTASGGNGTAIVGVNGKGNAQYANVTTHTDSCLVCHKGVANQSHGLTAATVGAAHNLSSNSSGGYSCTACHTTLTTGSAQLTKHMIHVTAGNVLADCYRCHAPAAYNTAYATTISATPATTVIATATASAFPGANLAANCEGCHTGKGVYLRHGLTDDGGADGVVDVHNMLGSSSGKAVTFSDTVYNASGARKVATYNCGNCHAPDPNTGTFTTTNALQVHTVAGGGTGTCLTCHVGATVATEITAGIAGTSQTCENCHETANGNGPSGKAMYQYDGVRHHTLTKAQQGDCTWCHADPRPAATTQATAYAYTADVNTGATSGGAYNTGWITDYATATPSVMPKQLGCRLCHTNYEVYAKNMGVDKTNNTVSTDAADLHGYNKTDIPTGFAVYKNEYAETVTVNTYPLLDTNQLVRGPVGVTQTQVASHTIAHNGASAKIQVVDYGACFACHSVQMFHAAPIPGAAVANVTAGTADYVAMTLAAKDNVQWDTIRYAPGRGVFNLFAGLASRGATSCTPAKTWDAKMVCAEPFSRGYNGFRADSYVGQGTIGARTAAPTLAEYSYGNAATNVGFQTIPGVTGINNYEGLTGLPTTGTIYATQGIVNFTNAPALPTTAGAVNDTYSTVPHTGTTPLAVTTNDTGSNLSITGLTQPSGGCGTTAISGLNINYTGNTTICSGSFTYTITSADFPAAPSTATVNVTTTTPPVLLMKKGSFARRTTTGTDIITGVGFQPKAIIFNWSGGTAEGYGTSFNVGQGFAAWNGTGYTMAANTVKATDNTATSATDGDGFHSNALAIATIAPGTVGATATLAEATITAMGADGFTVNWTKAGAGAEVIHYTVLGGDALTNANVGTTSLFAATGANPVTGVGFQPDAVLLLASPNGMTVGTFAPNGRVGVNLGYMVGGATPTQMSAGFGVRGAQVAADQASVLHNAQALTIIRGNAISVNATYTSMNPDGFTLNGSAASASNVSWLALKGGKFKVVEIAAKTGSIGTVATTGVGFQPSGLVFASINSTNTNGTIDTAATSLVMGSTDGTAQGTVRGQNTSANPSDANSFSVTTKAIRMATAITTQSEAGISSLNADGFTLNWTTFDTAARRIIAFAIGD